MRKLIPVAVFLFGAICGASMMGIFVVKRAEKFVTGDTSTMVTTATTLTAARLGLNAEQKQKLQPVAREMAERFEVLRNQNMPMVRDIIESAAEAAQPTLTEGQRKKLDELLAKPRERWKKIKMFDQGPKQ